MLANRAASFFMTKGLGARERGNAKWKVKQQKDVIAASDSEGQP